MAVDRQSLNRRTDRQTDRQTDRFALTRIETQFYKLIIVRPSAVSLAIFSHGTALLGP